MGRMVKPAKPTGLIASAARIDLGTKDYIKFSRGDRQWQHEAWAFYDSVGEFRYACDWVGSMLSKASLYAAQMTLDGPQRLDGDHSARQAVFELFAGPEGQTEMLRQIGIHFSVAGECYLFGWEGDEGPEWLIGASTKVTSRKSKDEQVWYVDSQRIGEGGPVLAIRLWRPHPERPWQATSPARAALPILAEIQGLTDHVAAQISSRLAGAGILMLPSEITFPKAPESENGDDGTVKSDADEFMGVLQEAMSTSIKNRSAASALVPIVVTAPGDAIQHAKHLTFWTELDRQASDLRTEGIRRLALNMDMPPEVLTGTGDSNHWSAWLADDSAIKAHTEPTLGLITHALSRGYLRPALAEEFSTDTWTFVVRADTSQMRLRPNRSKEAIELYDRAELSGAALRRETGFSEEDILEGEHLAQWFLQKAAMGQTTPEIVAAALNRLGADLPLLPTQEGDSHEARPVRSLREHPVTAPPEEQTSALLAAADMMVCRALERAGNRMRNRVNVPVQGSTAMTYYLHVDAKDEDVPFYLSDAWTHVDEIARRYGVKADWLESTLDTYCRLRLKSKTPHSFNTLVEFVEFTRRAA